MDRKKRGLPVGRAGRDFGKEFSEPYSVGCVTENLPIELSVKSVLLTNAFGESGCFLGTVQRC